MTGLTYSLAANLIGNLAYGYDQNGRRASVAGSFARTGIPNPNSTTAYNANNQLTTWGTANLFYDANGNMTSDGTHSYTWDARNQLKQIDSGSTASFSYDPLGRRVSKTILGVSTGFLYDGANPVQELSGSTPTANLLAGSLDEYFTRTDSSGTQNFLTDALGSSVALADSIGTVQASYIYEPFGSTGVAGSATTNGLAYTGRELDANGLYFYRARYYNPRLQRFNSGDPIGFAGRQANLYAYVFNSPTNFIDPLGMDAWDWLKNFSDFSNGAASVLTFGATDQINSALGNSQFVNKCSGWHTLGTVAGIGLSTAIGGAAGAEAAEANAGEKGFEFSHWIPDRWGGPRSLFNGNYVSTAEHALNDPFRYRFMDPLWKALNPMNPAWQQQWNRIPLLLKGAGAGAAAGGASTALNGRNCGCK